MKSPTKENLEKLSHHKQVMFACFCAEQVIHLVKEEHKSVCLKAVQTAYLFLEGKASKEECGSAANAAAAAYAYATAAAYANAAYANAAYAAYANATAAAYANAAYAANAAATAAATAAANTAYANADANKEQTIKEQWNFYDQLLNGDKYFEEIVLQKVLK